MDVLIQALKYQSRLALAPWFAAAVSGASAEKPDRLVPVPLHFKRLRERGFNQAMEIARPLGHAWNVPVDWRSCSRLLEAPPQAQLSWPERRRNVRAAFACAGRLDGLHVAVVDDVMTTGATLDEFARTLKRAGAARVTNCVVARTLPP